MEFQLGMTIAEMKQIMHVVDHFPWAGQSANYTFLCTCHKLLGNSCMPKSAKSYCEVILES